MKVGDMPRQFMEQTGRTFADYSVCIGRAENERGKNFAPIGSGVLVRKGKRFGILTADHVIDGTLRNHQLMLVLIRGQGVFVPKEVIIEHRIKRRDTVDFGPDLAFIEFLSSSFISTVKAISSFWSLDTNSEIVIEDFGKIGTPFAVVGFPGVHYRLKNDDNIPRHQIKHMAYFYAIGEKSIFNRGEWDYVEANCRYDDDNELPETFGGVSGGPLWAMHIARNNSNMSLEVKKFALIGIAFVETPIKERERQIRGHFIKSIYDVMWGKLV